MSGRASAIAGLVWTIGVLISAFADVATGHPGWAVAQAFFAGVIGTVAVIELAVRRSAP